MELFLIILFYLGTVIGIPILFWFNAKRRVLAVTVFVANVLWIIYFLGGYFSVMPEGETGVVIVGMIVLLPLFMVITDLLFWLAATLYSNAFNKSSKSTPKDGAI